MTVADADVTYARYLKLDDLLACQEPRGDEHDEVLFIVIHQATELWLKLVLHETGAAKRQIEAGAIEPAVKSLARVQRIFELITESWSVLATMTPPDYLSFRDVLGSGSGFQSLQFRETEFALGLKQARYLASFDDEPEKQDRLRAALAATSLYDAALGQLKAAGLPVPDAVLARDRAEPYEADTAVEDAWLEVYRKPREYWDLYELGEKLMDVEDAFRRWRFRHLSTVERVIGRKRGTGGTSGVDYLAKGLDRRAFPELWSVRTRL